MKYKIGDTVRIKEDLKSWRAYGGIPFSEHMGKYRGGIFTITKVVTKKDGYCCDGYHLTNCICESDDDFWFFSEEMLEPITDSKHPIMAEYTESPLSRDTTADLIKAIKSMMVLVNNSLVMQIMSDCLVALMALQEEGEKNNG